MALISRHYIDKNVVRSINHINEKLSLIAEGNLLEHVDERGTREFEELSEHINYMVRSLLGTTEKISELIDTTDFPVGVYEYNTHMKGVRTTKRLTQILGVEGAQAERLFSDYRRFENWIAELKTHPVEYFDEVYILSGMNERYIQISSFEEGSDRYGMFIDKTEEVRKYRKLEFKLDRDELTGLYSRYFFYRQMDDLFSEPEKLGHAMMLMIDSDDLKMVNDTYGHETGDRYLCSIADILQTVGTADKIIARLGGDEFAMFIYGAKDESELPEHVEQLKAKRDVSGLTVREGEDFTIRFSIGYAYVHEASDYHVLLKKADSRMYEDKQERKTNRV